MYIYKQNGLKMLLKSIKQEDINKGDINIVQYMFVI